MNRKLSRAVVLVLVLTMALSLMPMAGAASVMYAKTEVNVRSGPGTNYTVLGYLEKGDAVTVTGNVVGNWTQIQFSKYELGYVSSSYLTSKTGSSQSYVSGSKLKVCSDCGDIYYATTGLNVRSGPSTKYSKVGELEKGQQVTCIGKSGNWYKLLTTDGSAAYASASYLKLYKASSSSSIKEDTTNTAACGYYYATTGLNVRKGPGTSYRVIDELNKGDRVTYLGQSGNWYKVRTSRGIVGYCYKSYMSASTVKPSASNCGKHYCNECGVLVCTDNGCYTNGGVCYKDKYYCGSCYNFNWSCSTPVYGNSCYTFTAGETYRTLYGIVLYSEPSTSSPVTHTLLAGTEVTLVSGTSNANWLRVRVNECGCYGYLPARAIG